MHIVTYVDVQRNSVDEAVALLQQYRNDTQDAKGNSEVLFLRQMDRPNHFVIVEAWGDDQSFQSHETEHRTADFRTKLAAIHNGPNDQRVHHAFSVGQSQSRAQG